MSTAIMQQNTLYDFGDVIKMKGATDPQQGGLTNNQASAMRYTLTRMASSPGGTTNHSTTAVTLVSSILSLQQNPHKRLERTQSAPAPSVPVNTSRYKTELCRPFEEFGACKYGDKCQFAHGMSELRSLTRHPKYKTELCRTYHTVGFCPYGPRCHFVHNQEEAIQHNKAIMLRMQQQNAANSNLNLNAGNLNLSAGNLNMTRPSLSPSLSLDSPSPPCSLSQSPTSSLGSFFCSEPELHNAEEQRLPVFNRLANQHIPGLGTFAI